MLLLQEARHDMASTAPAHAPAHDRKQQIMTFMAGFSAETTPGAAAKIADYRAHLRPGTTVYITFLPGSDFADTVHVAARLAREGFEPVPHIAARSIPDRTYLDRQLARLTQEAGVTQVLAIGGGVSQPVGEFADTMQMLATGLFDHHGIRRIGLAGHPEGSPDISDAAIRAALTWKNEFARRSDAECYLVTQFCFQAAPVIAWARRIQTQGNRLPVYVGLPGLASIKALIGHAKACGVGPSMRMLTRQARNLATLLRVSAPDRQVIELAALAAADPACGIAGVHLYPLGGLTKTARWGRAVADGRFTLHADGRGFDVDMDA
jgi:methylenetetrahydrofolate reductase (NADPH)